MTKYEERSLRQPGQPWPGLNTRGGRLDDGSGWLEDGSINVQINTADTLEKRKGMVRGIDEYFGGVVCGLFRYLDYCGNEWLLVADEDGISIRQPFQLPQFTASDAYPNDTFDGNGEINPSRWRSFSRYERASNRMVQAATALSFSGSMLLPDLFMRWFKSAGALAYQVTVSYRFDASLTEEQRISAIIRGNGDLSTGAFIQADLVFDPAGIYRVEVYHRRADLTVTEILRGDLSGITTDPRGTMTLGYERDLGASTYQPTVLVLPNQGVLTRLRAVSLSAVEDVDLGLASALAVAQKGGTVSQGIGVEIVTGGPV